MIDFSTPEGLAALRRRMAATPPAVSLVADSSRDGVVVRFRGPWCAIVRRLVRPSLIAA